MKGPHLIALLLAAFASVIRAECVRPEPPPKLNAKKMAPEVFEAGYRQANEFLQQGDAYLKCIETVERNGVQAGAVTDEGLKKTRRQSFHQTADQMRGVSENLKAESAVFEQRTGRPPGMPAAAGASAEPKGPETTGAAAAEPPKP